MADELSTAADAIRCSRPPEMVELGKIAEHILIAGYYHLGDLMDTSVSEDPQLYIVPLDERPSWARAMRVHRSGYLCSRTS